MIRGTMDHYSITIQNFGVLQVNFSMIVRKTRHHVQADITFGTLIRCSHCHTTRSASTAAESVGFCWPVLVMAAVESHNVCCSRTWPSNQTVGGVILAFSSFFNQILHQEKSRWVYLAPHEDNRIQVLSTVRSRRWKNSFMVHLKLHRLIE
jgi:hypothetical protein